MNSVKPGVIGFVLFLFLLSVVVVVFNVKGSIERSFDFKS